MFDYTNYKYYDIKGREINMNEWFIETKKCLIYRHF
jgi:hypothetical protein